MSLRVLMVSTQRPGYGGAATSTYEVIKALREIGVDVEGLFIDHCADPACDRTASLPYKATDRWYDPEDIGGIDGIGTCAVRSGAAAIPDPGRFDVVVGKNYGAAAMVGAAYGGRIPTVYWTSGLPAASHLSGPFTEMTPILPEALKASPDYKAIEATDVTMVHSTLLMDFYRRTLPDAMVERLRGVVPTPDLVRVDELPDSVPYPARMYDLALVASTWSRPVKGPWLAKYASLVQGSLGGRVVICGGDWKHPSQHETQLGLVSHAQVLRTLADSRVVLIPSWFDAAPNVYTEAVLLGCNAIVTPCVGNIDGHPGELLAEPTPESVSEALRYADAAVGRQLQYRAIEPRNVVDQVIDVLTEAASM